MGKNVPFAIMPLHVMKRAASPFMGIGYRISKTFPMMQIELEQAEIDAEAEEYAAIMVFNFFVYFVMFALIASFLLGRMLTNTKEVLGIALPESMLIGLLVGAIVGFLIYVQMSMYPKMQIKKKVRAIESNLVYALRTMLVQIKSGVSLFDSLGLIATGKYGALSVEIKRAVDEMRAGVAQDVALQRIATNNPSPYLRKAVWQIVNGMKAGADVADVLHESVASMIREQQIEIQRYGSSLRVLSLVYLMIGVIIPALGLTFLIVLGSFPKIEITELTFWMLLGGVIVAEFMFLGVIKSKRPNLMMGA